MGDQDSQLGCAAGQALTSAGRLCPQCGLSEATDAVTLMEPATGINNAASAGLWQRIIRRIVRAILLTARLPYWLLALSARAEQMPQTIAVDSQTSGA